MSKLTPFKKPNCQYWIRTIGHLFIVEFRKFKSCIYWTWMLWGMGLFGLSKNQIVNTVCYVEFHTINDWKVWTREKTMRVIVRTSEEYDNVHLLYLTTYEIFCKWELWISLYSLSLWLNNSPFLNSVLGCKREEKRGKRWYFLFTCLERVGGEKRKEKKIFNLDIWFYLNTPNKNLFFFLWWTKLKF